jgi:hypothetical protein
VTENALVRAADRGLATGIVERSVVPTYVDFTSGAIDARVIGYLLVSTTDNSITISVGT